MRCTNCGASIPRDLGACPECGVFARVVDKPKRRTSRGLIVVLLIVIAGAAGAYFLTTRTEPPKSKPAVRVVHDRPGGARVGAGAAISEPEAILRLRRSLDVREECVAVLSHGFHDGAYVLSAVNRCEHTQLGRWRVDGKSGTVSR